jgi:alanyl-tRNA synthetase
LFQGANPPVAVAGQSTLELSERFGFEPDLSNDVIQQRLMEIQEQLRRQILTEMRLKVSEDIRFLSFLYLPKN